ncbi:Acetyltransferase (GNAT) family protein [Curtobacterium sp. 314Chir4.1]|uniref:GNAT family N-acetyltransferase n=1 Tax=Curtobacterium sp. 314Chir4.1 TaxID=1279028 RepID=UPI000BCD80C6|nr:GNAT family N-acetyltransferase [Curtobacterium sp. 314Chir4.1]SOC88107.1 Acetyltransferase (GNAT) family protein [Curtobacterium sp. 314Chir4.1]
MPAVVRELGGASADGDVAALQDLLESVPDGFDPAGKAGLGLWEGERLVAFADVLLGYPVPSTAYIGLLVVRGGEQGRGLGRAMHEAVVERVRAASEGSRTGHSDVERLPVERVPVERLRLGVVATNASVAEPFWRALGYEPTGEEQPYRYDHLVSTVALWERPL